MMTGLLRLFCTAPWSSIHCTPQDVTGVSPQPAQGEGEKVNSANSATIELVTNWVEVEGAKVDVVERQVG